MTPEEIRILLKAVASGDRRTTGPEDVHFWAVMAQRGRWTLPEAMAALVEFRHSRPGVWLEPGHLSALIRAARQDAAVRVPIGFTSQLPPPMPVPELVAFRSMPRELEDPDLPAASVRQSRPARHRRRLADPTAREAARAELAARRPTPMPTTTEGTDDV
jgi:hypothetical protein